MNDPLAASLFRIRQTPAIFTSWDGNEVLRGRHRTNCSAQFRFAIHAATSAAIAHRNRSSALNHGNGGICMSLKPTAMSTEPRGGPCNVTSCVDRARDLHRYSGDAVDSPSPHQERIATPPNATLLNPDSCNTTGTKPVDPTALQHDRTNPF
jgi:hypothetical protein